MRGYDLVTKKLLIPRIKPLQKLVSRARDLRDAHELRHRPTGFGFALADSVDYLDADRWDTLTTQGSLFFSRRYLRVLEDAAPDNLQQRYALIFRGREPVAAVAAQLVTISLARVGKAGNHRRARLNVGLKVWTGACWSAEICFPGACTAFLWHRMKIRRLCGPPWLKPSIEFGVPTNCPAILIS
jgi:hypothetical protein